MRTLIGSALSAFIPLGASSSIHHSEISGPVIALKVPSVSTEPLWFAVSFDRTESEIHGPSFCPAFLECPSVRQLDSLATLGGMALGDLGAVEFRSRPAPPQFHDVSGVLGLNPRSSLAKAFLITLSETDNHGTRLDFAARESQNEWNTVAWFESVKGSGNGWLSEGHLAIRNEKGKSTMIESTGVVEWNPISGDVILPSTNRRHFEHVIKNCLFMECSRLEKRSGLAPIELILGKDHPHRVRITISIVRMISSTTINRFLGFKTTLCATNVIFHSNVVEIGMKTVLDKYDVVLDGSSNRINFVDKSSTVTDSGTVNPIHPPLRTFRLIPELGGSFAGWVWRQTGERTDKDFFFLSKWPFGNTIEIAPAKEGNVVFDMKNFVPVSSVQSWAGTPKITMHTEGYFDIEIKEEPSWIIKKVQISRPVSNRGVIQFAEVGRRYIWDKESKLDGANQQLIAKPSIGRLVPDEEFYIQWPPRLDSQMFHRGQRRANIRPEIQGVWFGKPVLQIDNDNRIIISSDGQKQDYMMSHYSTGSYVHMRFREIERYIPVITGTSNILFKHVYGPIRYDDEFKISSTHLGGERGHYEKSLSQIEDRPPNSIKIVLARLKALEGKKFNGTPVLDIDQVSKDITIRPQNNGEELTITVESSSSDSVTISFDGQIARFIVPSGLTLAGSRIVFPAKRGAYESGEFTLDSWTPKIERMGNGQFRLTMHNVIQRSYDYYIPLFDSVGKWYGEPQISIDTNRDLVLSGKDDMKEFTVYVYENKNPMELIFTPTGR